MQTLSVQVNLASFLTRATRSSFLFPISKGRKPLASSNTESNDVNSFLPSTVLLLLYTSIKTGCLEQNSQFKNNLIDVKVLKV